MCFFCLHLFLSASARDAEAQRRKRRAMGGRRAISGAALLRCWSATFSSSSKHWRSRKSNTRGQHREMVLGLCKFALSERTCISMCVRAPARSRVDACVTNAQLHVGGTAGQIAASAPSTYRTDRSGCAIDRGHRLVRLSGWRWHARRTPQCVASSVTALTWPRSRACAAASPISLSIPPR